MKATLGIGVYSLKVKKKHFTAVALVGNENNLKSEFKCSDSLLPLWLALFFLFHGEMALNAVLMNF